MDLPVPLPDDLPGVTVETRPDGVVIQLAPTMSGFRSSIATFLSCWLVGWAVGEISAAGFLFGGLVGILKALVAGHLAQALALTPVVGFLAFWLSLWTLGGYCAGRELLRLLTGRLTVEIQNKSLVFEWRIGLSHTRYELPAGSITRLVARRNGRLTVSALDHAPLELDPAADPRALPWLAAVLRSAAGLPETTAESVLPDGWIAVEEKGGHRVGPVPVEGWWARWLATERPTLFVAPGVFEIRQSSNHPAGWSASPRGRFELRSERDSEGDETWHLDAYGESGRTTVCQDEPDDLRVLARYLGWRTGFPVSVPAALERLPA